MWNWYVVDCESSISGCPHGTQLEHQRIDVHHVCSARYWSGGLSAKLYETVSVHHQCIFNGKPCSGLWHIWNLLLPKNWPARRFACLCRARRACEMLGRFPRRGAIHGDLGAAGGSKNEKMNWNQLNLSKITFTNIDWELCLDLWQPVCCFRIPKLRTANLTHLAMAKRLNLKSFNYIWIPPTHHSEHIVHANKTAEPVFFL